MILIVANELDTAAQEAAKQWPGGLAVVLTPRDLCTSGWRIDPGAFHRSQIVAAGRVYSVSDITGVLTLMPYVMDYELVSIEESERKYAATEISALLFYFLSTLPCPVLNRPTAYCLVGPSWRLAQWNAALVRAGISTGPIRPESPIDARDLTSASTSISVIGRKCVGEKEVVSASSALKLARLAGVEFLTIRLQGEDRNQSVRSIELVPDLQEAAIRDAVQSYFMN